MVDPLIEKKERIRVRGKYEAFLRCPSFQSVSAEEINVPVGEML